MKHTAIRLLTAALTLAVGGTASAEDVGLHVTVNRTQIYVGESVVLTVKVAGMDNPPEPDLSGIKGFRAKLLGSHSDSRHSISIINGRIQRESFTGRTFTYELTPDKPGTFEAGPVVLNLPGKPLRAAGPAVTVSGLEKQDWVKLSLEASRETVLVDEPFEITLTIEILCLEGRYAAIDPLDPSAPPRLDVEFLENKPIEGLETPNLVEILQKHLVSQPQRPGFAVNNYTVRNDPFDFRGFFSFDGFRNERTARFMFPRQTVTRGNRAYQRYTLTLRYTAREEGGHTFGPAVFKGPVFTAVDAAGNPSSRPVFAVGPAVTVRVTPPPEENRPPTFTGIVGSSLSLAAALDAQTCNAGDPLTLTLSLSGDFNSRNAHPPVLGDNSALNRDFRVYDDTVRTERKDGSIDYLYTLRPRRAGTLELPPIEVSYYDIGARAYRAAASSPLPVHARQAAEVAETIILNTATGAAAAARLAEDQKPIPAPLDMSPAGSRPGRIFVPRLHLPLLAIGPAVWALAALARAAAGFIARLAVGNRRKTACLRALDMLREAGRIAPEDPSAAGGIICEALGNYLRARFNASAGELTPDGVRGLLRAKCRDADAADTFCKIFERNFNAAFTPSGTATANDCADALRVVMILEREGG